MKLLTIVFSFLSFAAFAQTGSMNASLIRFKLPDTASTVMTGYKGGIRLKDQSGQTKMQLTVNGSSWLDMLASIDGLTTNYIPKATSSTTLGNSSIFDDGTTVGINTVLGINMDAAARNLVVGSGSGNTGLTVYSGTTGAGSIHFADGFVSGQKFEGYVNYNHSTNSMQFGTSSLEAFRVNSSQQVGIGTTSPSARLHSVSTPSSNSLILQQSTATAGYQQILFSVAGSVTGTAGNGAAIRSTTDRSTNNFSTLEFYTSTDASVSPTQAMHINGLQNIGIGDTSPSFKLDVNGTIASQSLTSGRVPYVSTGGSLVDESGFEYNTSSNTLTVQDIVSTGNLYTNNTADRVAVTTTSGRVTTDSDLLYDAVNNILTSRRYKVGATPVANAVLYMDSGGEFLYQSGLTFNSGTNTLFVENVSTSGASNFTAGATGSGDATFGSNTGSVALTTNGGAGEQIVIGTNAGGVIRLVNLPTSSAGLPSGAIWSNSNVLTIVP